MVFDLKTDDGLRRACKSVDFDSEGLKDRLEKTKTYSSRKLPTHRENSFSAEKYQKRLWGSDNPICDHVTHGPTTPRVEIRRVIQDGENLLVWFCEEVPERFGQLGKPRSYRVRYASS